MKLQKYLIDCTKGTNVVDSDKTIFKVYLITHLEYVVIGVVAGVLKT